MIAFALLTGESVFKTTVFLLLLEQSFLCVRPGRHGALGLLQRRGQASADRLQLRRLGLSGLTLVLQASRGDGQLGLHDGRLIVEVQRGLVHGVPGGFESLPGLFQLLLEGFILLLEVSLLDAAAGLGILQVCSEGAQLLAQYRNLLEQLPLPVAGLREL